jgi:hypothetical protein
MPNHAMQLASKSNATETTAADRNPATMRSRPWLTSAPNIATPMAPPACRAVFKMAEAVPAQPRSTLPRMLLVIAGTASPRPLGISTNAGNMTEYELRASKRSSRAKPSAPSKAPRHIGARAPMRADSQPLVGKRCLDWTERRFHVGGPLGVQLTHALLEKLWLRRLTGSRALAVTPAGERGFRALFGVHIQRGVSVWTDLGPP